VYGEVPTDQEWLIISDREFDSFSGEVDSADVYRRMRSLLKCPECARLWIFWDGLSRRPQEYARAEEPAEDSIN
jgi:hypothetical protein